ncbi:DMT family transporter [Pusillimonas minor]|uniref:DMT family transporter n=1 Tax=Pusillimonas minor TaxID=2697024 RepID=A0A842HNV9_9BURK|nr:DMT family transporter [Pusillimonas minor]MBC2768970.1 DMT family transporter [Pusillimonas minor]
MPLKDLRNLIILSIIWSGSFLFMLLSIHEVGPMPLIEIRAFAGGVFLMALVIALGKMPSLIQNWRVISVAGLFNSAFPFLMLAYAAQHLTSGLLAILNAMTPLFGGLIARVWLKERMTAPRIGGLVLGFAGILILVSDDLQSSSGATHLLPVIAGLGAPLCYAIAACYSGLYLKTVDPMASAAGSVGTTAIIFMPLALLTWPDSAQVSVTAWSAAIALGVLCTGLAYVLLFRLLASVGPTKTITVTFLVPPMGVMWGVIFLGEPLTPAIVVGACVVLAGTFLATGVRFRRTPKN